MTANSIATVQFHGHPLTTAQHNGEPHVAMRPIVEAVGLNWKAQYDRIQRDDVLRASVVMMTTVAEDGKQRELVCLPLKLLNGWLFGIDTGRLKPELRETIGTYKRECYDALYRYWHEGQATNPRFRPEKTRKTLPGGLTVEQQDAIKALVKSRVEILPHEKQAKAAITCWSAVKSKFGCSYKEVPAANFPDVLSLVARLDLEKAKPVPAIHFPAETAMPEWTPERVNGYGQLHLCAANTLFSPNWKDPEWELLELLRDMGFDVSGPIISYKLKMAIIRFHEIELPGMLADLIPRLITNKGIWWDEKWAPRPAAGPQFSLAS